MKNNIRSLIPAPIRSAARDMMYRFQGTIHLLTGKRTSLIPPVGLMNDGPQDYEAFKKNGEVFLTYYKDLCDLQPDAAILDVGCGMGRKTIPLIAYLNENGRYEGLDINRDGINWCQKGIGTKRDNFHFQLIDVYNKKYNPSGQGKAYDYRFPFDDDSFDLVVLGSVFTHMLSRDLENYLSEIARVLRHGGQCLITFFLLNEESTGLISEQRSSLNFKYEMGESCYSVDTEIPEQAIAYDESYIWKLYQQAGLEIKTPVYFGNWCERKQTLMTEYQDIIVARKS
jgi:SAM-dependent methyltransferase